MHEDFSKRCSDMVPLPLTFPSRWKGSVDRLMAGGRSVVVGGKGPRELVERGGGEGRGEDS